MSNLLKISKREQTLRTIISRASSLMDKDLASVQIAILYVRQGHFNLAKSELVELKERNRSSPDMRRSIWIHLAEGLLEYFDNLGECRSDGIHRAFALSEASGALDLLAISAAWMAQINYSFQDMLALGKNLKLALENGLPENHFALSRAFLVGAQALDYGGRPDLAKPWYEKSRYHAILDEDEVTIGAIMHNMGWLRVLNFRQLVLRGVDGIDISRHMRLGIESTSNYEDMIGDIGWIGLRSVLRAQIFSLTGKFQDALSIYKDHNEGDTTHRMRSNFLADQAWCFAMVGEREMSNSCIARALELLSNNVHADDRAATHSRISAALSVTGDAAGAKKHAVLASVSWSAHQIMQQNAVRIINEINELGKYISAATDSANTDS